MSPMARFATRLELRARRVVAEHGCHLVDDPNAEDDRQIALTLQKLEEQEALTQRLR